MTESAPAPPQELDVLDGAPAPGTPPELAARFAAAQALLESAGLPRLGPGDAPVRFFLVTEAGALVACAGWERHGADALLRSVAVAPERRGRRQGERLVRGLLERLAADGVRGVWLLTESAAPFFQRLGFRPAPRAEAPAAVRASRQFDGGCCSAAACLGLALVPTPDGETPSA